MQTNKENNFNYVKWTWADAIPESKSLDAILSPRYGGAHFQRKSFDFEENLKESSKREDTITLVGLFSPKRPELPRMNSVPTSLFLSSDTLRVPAFGTHRRESSDCSMNNGVFSPRPGSCKKKLTPVAQCPHEAGKLCHLCTPQSPRYTNTNLNDNQNALNDMNTNLLPKLSNLKI